MALHIFSIFGFLRDPTYTFLIWVYEGLYILFSSFGLVRGPHMFSLFAFIRGPYISFPYLRF